MDFTTDFYFRQTWQDPRLSFTPLPGIDNLYVGAEVAGRIWVPDTFFTNEKSAYFHEATTPNTFLRISSKGEVLRSIRLTVTASCPMLLQYFPMDSQLCSIEVESCKLGMFFSLCQCNTLVSLMAVFTVKSSFRELPPSSRAHLLLLLLSCSLTL